MSMSQKDGSHPDAGTERRWVAWLVAAMTLAGSPLARVAVAAGSAPVVDAGPTKVIAFPARDLTLFGHASDPDGDAMTYSWSQVSGPAGASFSAPWALATTVTFTNAGTYVFRLTAGDSTSTVTADTTVTVRTAASQTAFYVDPTFVGGNNDGSATRPWTNLSARAGDPQWVAINAALASNNVIVYFSARTASSDVAEIEHDEVNIWRTDTSSNRLTLDGVSLYNTSDTIGSWAANTRARFHIDITSGAMSIGVQSSNTGYPMNYTTIRGFELSGGSGRALIAGNATVFEYNYVHDVTVTGATVQFQAAVRDYPGCTKLFGNLRDITFRGNQIERGEGESIYIAGTYARQADGGCVSWGNTHSDILIENNIVGEAGSNSGEHDGIDLKAGLTNVTVRGNLITDRPAGTKAISASGVFTAPGACCIGNYLIEGNVFRNNMAGAVVLQKQSGAVVRNNLSVGGGWFSTSGDDSTSYWTNQNVRFYNNTIYGSSSGIVILNANNVSIINNLVFNNAGDRSIQGNSTATNVTEDYNAYDKGSAQVTSGGHSIMTTTGSGLVVNIAAGNFRPATGSLIVDAGLNLRPTGFLTDIEGTARQVTAAWEIGAYTVGSSSPAPPANLRLVP
jgi:hypothetical protein